MRRTLTAHPTGPRRQSPTAVHGPQRPGRPRTLGAMSTEPENPLVFDDPLAQPSRDDTDEGWGERPAAEGSAADLARFLDEKPPHHI
ncbi:hypothetical protein OG946_13580 [Streptomyces sp. NBC_01808]|nr:hypothetical protein [Streptomyces sp. NBC_01808]WSA38311.1 hypothetical protein OG946_13580 [Streptomyces sp. NBC_01808]